MSISRKKEVLSDIEKLKKFLLGIGFVCKSYPSAGNLIYSKKGKVVIIKNEEVDRI
jgi:hypothetical protein